MRARKDRARAGADNGTGRNTNSRRQKMQTLKITLSARERNLLLDNPNIRDNKIYVPIYRMKKVGGNYSGTFNRRQVFRMLNQACFLSSKLLRKLQTKLGINHDTGRY